MDLSELLRESLRTLKAHALRSFLTLLGVIIGVATLVGVMAVIAGLNAFVRDKVFALAPDVVIISKFGIIRSREEWIEAVKRRSFDWRDYQHLRSLLKNAEQVGASVRTGRTVKFRDHRLEGADVHGTTANFGRILDMDLAAGRFFIDGEEQAAQHVAVIGWDVKDELFPQLDPLGRTILVGGSPFTVVGVFAKQGNSFGQSRDSQLYVPIEAFRRTFGNRDSLDLFIQARGGVLGIDAATDEARSVVRALRHTAFRAPDPFGIVTSESLQNLWGQISAAAFILSLLIASVSLGVGGIVIMNIMLVAVVERTPEIGLRRALGARKRDIRRQFLLEAALLSVAGGLIGVLLGALGALLVNGVLHFPAQPTLTIVLLGLGLSGVVGIAAGYWPARSASNLLVVDALRSD
ncbi:MAG: ABC transporter permease [Acidobacteriota bacterium]|nr:ABC transporter permease [Acidobacteriota bacterium]